MKMKEKSGKHGKELRDQTEEAGNEDEEKQMKNIKEDERKGEGKEEQQRQKRKKKKRRKMETFSSNEMSVKSFYPWMGGGVANDQTNHNPGFCFSRTTTDCCVCVSVCA